jgi:hypothetical protein
MIDGKMQKDEAALRLSKICSGQKLSAVDTVSRILSVPSQPLPVLQDSGIARQGKRRLNPWTSAEDQRLLAGIHKYGIENWVAIATFVGNGRSRAQCSQRWNRGLNPQLRKTRWLPEEEARLMDLVSKFGVKAWTQIAQEMLNRSDVQCRYHYLQIQRASEPGGSEVRKTELQFVSMDSPISVDHDFGIAGVSSWAEIDRDEFGSWSDMLPPAESLESVENFTDYSLAFGPGQFWVDPLF